MPGAAPTISLAWSPCDKLSSRSPNRLCLFSSWVAAGQSPDPIASAPRLVVRKQPVTARASVSRPILSVPIVSKRGLFVRLSLGNGLAALRFGANLITLCAARGLETAALRPLAHEGTTIYTDAQAVIRRMGSDEPGPGQRYALEARKQVVTIRRRRPGVTIELHWCPAHKGVPGNEKVLALGISLYGYLPTPWCRRRTHTRVAFLLLYLL
jgi:hypothetical protein